MRMETRMLLTVSASGDGWKRLNGTLDANVLI